MEGVAAEKKLRELGMVSQDIMSVDEMLGVAGSREGADPSEKLHEHVAEEAFDDVGSAGQSCRCGGG